MDYPTFLSACATWASAASFGEQQEEEEHHSSHTLPPAELRCDDFVALTCDSHAQGVQLAIVRAALALAFHRVVLLPSAAGAAAAAGQAPVGAAEADAALVTRLVEMFVVEEGAIGGR